MSHIDYVGASFTMRLHDFSLEIRRVGLEALNGIVPRDLWKDLSGIKAGKKVHRKPYKDGLVFTTGFSVFFGGQDTLLVEISGTGCKNTDILEWMRTVRDDAGLFLFTRFTRIDIAEDSKTDELPFDAVTRWGISGKIKTRNVQDSPSGQTFYVGSRKSDRFCRVYRYKAPHPRSEWLRTEFQFNKKVADHIAEQLLNGVSTHDIFQKSAQVTFKAFDLDEGRDTSASVATSHERSRGGSVVWFYAQVAPALARLVDEQELSMEDIFTAIADRRSM